VGQNTSSTVVVPHSLRCVYIWIVENPGKDRQIADTPLPTGVTGAFPEIAANLQSVRNAAPTPSAQPDIWVSEVRLS
jgi:hypothetical protein